MLLVILKVALKDLTFCSGVKATKPRFHAVHPLTSVMITTIPHVLTLPVPLVHVELSLVVTVLKEHASRTMMIAL